MPFGPLENGDLLRRYGLPGAALAGLWLLLSDGDPSSWMVGIPTIALALIWGRQATSAPAGNSINLPGLLRFIAYFIYESARGGLDVSRRILAPELDVQPGQREYACRLADKRARLLFANCVSLLPGTLSAELRQDSLIIHQLDIMQDTEAELRRLEQSVAEIFTRTREHGGESQ